MILNLFQKNFKTRWGAKSCSAATKYGLFENHANKKNKNHLDCQSNHDHCKGCEQAPVWIAQQASNRDDAKIDTGYHQKDRVLIREFRGMPFEKAKLPEIIEDRLQVGSIHDEALKDECASKFKKMIIRYGLASALDSPVACVDRPNRF